MKKIGVILLILIILTALSACLNTVSSEAVKREIPVNIMEIKEEIYPVTLEYIGIVEAMAVKKYSFKTSGKIAQVFVTEGQTIKTGDKLIELNSEDLSFSLQAAKAQLDSAQAQYDQAIKGASDESVKQAELNVAKAEEAYNYAHDNYQKLLQLYQEGSISKNDLDQAELEMNIRKKDFEIAQQMELEAKTGASKETKRILLSQVEQAKVNYQQQKNLLDNSLITSDTDGFVVKVLYEEGENVLAGYPVIVIRNDNIIVTAGITQEDLDQVKLDQTVIVQKNEVNTDGKIIKINSVPDQITRTYNIEIEIPDKTFHIGTIVDLTIILKEEKGILIPVNSIINNGSNTYVFIVQNQTAVKKNITIKETTGLRVSVTGLAVGEQLITEGNTKVAAGDKVTVK